MADQTLDKKGVLKAMFFAILIAFLGIGILGWQYRQIEKEQIPALEEKIEKRSVEDVLDRFMQARIEKDEASALRYLTEVSMEQKNQGEFLLIDNFASFEVLKTEKFDQDNYRYIIKIYEEDGIGDFIEVINLIKILDRYYINSVQIAGWDRVDCQLLFC